MAITVGVLALQGAFIEHIHLLQKAAPLVKSKEGFEFIEVRTLEQLLRCDGLIIPGGESTTLSLIAQRNNLLEPLRDFVKVERKPTWGTCAGLIMLAEAANSTKKGGQELIGGLDVRVHRNHFGRQIESFETGLDLPFLAELQAEGESPPPPFPGIFIRAPIVDKLLPHVHGEQAAEAKKDDTVVAPAKEPRNESAAKKMSDTVEVMGVLPGRNPGDAEAGDIIAVRQGNVFGTSFHPELTDDLRIHQWWLQKVVDSKS
ncbi:uncharacterized protein E0L32_009882 [Thyridium curvatum]|uniref:glutaminase n=1 Tax=Thyridium curvatum TaxID=1093900 RepID=A0A507AM38_9PEZI|nr:uncharacterized protein E0L32_009882 [Thyridium curvatum]TPX08693.1 hypothetical protein E0L32_009882 [Thyridium curvatum]